MHFTPQRAETFLEDLNVIAHLVGGELQEIPGDIQHGQLLLATVKTQKLAYAMDLDLILQTGCAHLAEYATSESLILTIGTELNERQASSVLIYPVCCGPYNEGFKDLLESTFREVKWYVPRVPNLFDTVWLNSMPLYQVLFAAGIIVGE